MNYKTAIGLETHVQLLTRTKIFCGCPANFGAEANTCVCPVCLGMPGVLPVLNERAFELAIKTALTLNCALSGAAKFDRKNYFYPDLPKNFQISQYDAPLAGDGFLEVETDGEIKRVRIKRVHLEEDAGKLIHESDCSLVDFNRAGIALLEIVTEPDITSAREAYDYLIKLKNILRYLEVSDCNMEEGSLRCDANISLAPFESEILGVKTEIKNMNSFKAVKSALEYEIERHNRLLENGKKVIQETMLWDSEKMKTSSMRGKEDAFDYRYFPEPDLPVFKISEEKIKKIKASLPELPVEKKNRFIKEYGLSDYDADVITAEKKTADFFEEVVKILNEPKLAANWLTGPMFNLAKKNGLEAASLGVAPRRLAELIKMVLDGKVNITAAKEKILPLMMQTSQEPALLVEQEGLVQISDSAGLEEAVQEVIKENHKSVSDYIAGKEKAVMFLVGQVMRRTKGKANPQIVKRLIEDKIKTR